MPKVTVDEAKAMMRDDYRAMRREYTRMRDIAQKRVGRLLQTEFSETVGAKHQYDTGMKDAEGNPIYKAGFPTLKSLDPRDFAKAFSELSKFVSAKGSVIKGQQEIKEKTTERLNKSIGNKDEQGNPITPVNPGNYWRVIKILDEARRQKVTYDSNKMVELADATLELSKEQFDVILDNLQNTLLNSDTIQGSLEQYMADKKVEGYQQVNIDDFLEAMGWKV